MQKGRMEILMSKNVGGSNPKLSRIHVRVRGAIHVVGHHQKIHSLLTET